MAGDGGYIMDASAIVQNDARVENIRAMTDFTREYGIYSSGMRAQPAPGPQVWRRAFGRPAASVLAGAKAQQDHGAMHRPGGQEREGWPPVKDDEELIRECLEPDRRPGQHVHLADSASPSEIHLTTRSREP